MEVYLITAGVLSLAFGLATSAQLVLTRPLTSLRLLAYIGISLILGLATWALTIMFIWPPVNWSILGILLAMLAAIITGQLRRRTTANR